MVFALIKFFGILFIIFGVYQLLRISFFGYVDYFSFLYIIIGIALFILSNTKKPQNKLLIYWLFVVIITIIEIVVWRFAINIPYCMNEFSGCTPPILLIYIPILVIITINYFLIKNNKAEINLINDQIQQYNQNIPPAPAQDNQTKIEIKRPVSPIDMRPVYIIIAITIIILIYLAIKAYSSYQNIPKDCDREMLYFSTRDLQYHCPIFFL